MKPVKYIARHPLGEIVGKRSSHRVYTHAVITQHDEAAAREAAYQYVQTADDISNFKYNSDIAAKHVGDPKRIFGNYTAEEIANAKAQTEGGIDAYIARVRQTHVERFEASLANGYYKPHAATWCGRLDLAQKAVGQFTGPHTKLIAIVEVEVIA